jgi:cytochrome P450
MAMCLYPVVQKKAQAELDQVLIGRLPDFNDRDNLPYINAIVKESMRWQPVGPLGRSSKLHDALLNRRI